MISYYLFLEQIMHSTIVRHMQATSHSYISNQKFQQAWIN